MPTKIPTRSEIQDTINLGSRAAAEALGIGKTSVNKYRREYGITKSDRGITDGYSFVQGTDGTVTATTKPTTAPQTLEDAYKLLTTKGLDVGSYDVSYGFVERELASGAVTHQYTMKAVPKKKSGTPDLDADELIKVIDNYVFDFVPEPKATNPQSFVIAPSDMQIGKTSFNGGTTETVERVLESFGTAAAFAKEFRPESIVIAELGDPLENFYSTSSQRETNDLDLTGQIRVARRLLLDGIKQLAPYAPRVVYASVPSNHGSVRVGFKAPAGDNHNDWGLEILDQLQDAVEGRSGLEHVEFQKPVHLYESMMVEASNTKLGLVHGHQARGAEKLGEWWKGQDHGRQPTANADILLSGHWHSFRVQHSGNGRWIMVSPASDPGSDWFTNITGEWSESGMLSFTTADGHWDNLRIL